MPVIAETQETTSPSNDAYGEMLTKNVTVSFAVGNLLGILMGIIPAALLVAMFALVWLGKPVMPPPEGVGVIHTILILLGGILIHELLHGLGWLLFGRAPLKSIKLGIAWKALSPYAHTSARMPLNGYRWGVLLPGLLLGIVPGLIAVPTGSITLLFCGFLFTAVAGGDFLVLWLLRGLPPDAEVADHPSQVGAVAYIKAPAPEQLAN